MDHTISSQVQLANAELTGQVGFYFLSQKPFKINKNIIYFLDINIVGPGGIYHPRPLGCPVEPRGCGCGPHDSSLQ
jgi:hypothetical protein